MKSYNEVCVIDNHELAPAMTRLAYRYVETDVSFAFALLARAAVLWCPMAQTIISLLMKRRAGRMPKTHRGYSWSWWSWSVAILLHNSTLNKVAAALLKRVPQEMVKNIYNWKFCSEHSWMVFTKMERMIESFYQMSKSDTSNVQAAMATCEKAYRSKYGIAFFNPSQSDRDENRVLELLDLTEKHPSRRKRKAEKERIVDKPKEMSEIIDESIHELCGESITWRTIEGSVYSIHSLKGKIFIGTEFDKTGIWFAKASSRPRWSSHNESIPSPVHRLYSFVRFVRDRVPQTIGIVSFVALKRECDIVEMDEGCIAEWQSQGLFCVRASEEQSSLVQFRSQDAFPIFKDFLISKVDNDYTVFKGLQVNTVNTPPDGHLHGIDADHGTFPWAEMMEEYEACQV